MSNLLDSASIVLTPTAYDNGRMLSVKPNTDLFGAELLTQPVNLVTDFTTNSGGVIVDADTFTTSGGSLDGIKKSFLTVGKSYKLVIEGDTTSSGFTIGSLGNSGNEYGSGFGTHYFECINSGLWIRQITSGTTNITSFSIKEDLSGDFDFSRNSAATRVNAQGLVENVQILSGDLVSNGDFSQEGVQEVSNGSFSQEGAELVTNGDFATDSNWVKQAAWSISGGTANSNGSSGSLYQNSVVEIGKSYLCEFEITSITSGSVAINAGGNTTGTSRTSIGTYSEILYVVSGSNDRSYIISQSFIGSIDNVSVKEVGQDWTLGTGWSIGEDKAVHTGTQSLIGQSNTLTIGKTYKITFDLSGADGSNYARLLTSQYPNGGNYSSDGTISVYTITNIDDLYIYGVGDISITNISVKEVGQDWTLGGTATIGDNLVNINSPSGENAEVYQSSVLVIGRKYKLDCTLNKISGDTQFVNGGTFVLNNGSNIIEFTATDTRVYFKRGAGSVVSSITNISVVEITDDTNLPRINYEGFSYQDSLGSEEVVNGDFSDGINSWSNKYSATISVVNGQLEITGSATGSGRSSQGITTTIGASYLLKATITNVNSSGIAIKISQNSNLDGAYFNSASNTTTNPVEVTHTFIATSTTTYIGTNQSGSSGSTAFLDNVSVKEYLGQEVVPDSGCGSWLLEPQSTNLVTYSEDYNFWAKTSANVTSNAVTSPEGVQNASKIVEASGLSFHFILSSASVGSGSTTFSFYAKAAERTSVSAFLSQGGNNGANFDLSAETATAQGTGNTASIESVGNGWYRCIVSNNGSAQVASQVRIGIQNGALDSYVGDGTSGVYIWGAQVEQQSYSTSYIPTNGAASTRLQDIANNSGNATLINSTEGVLYAEIAALADDGTSRIISLNDGTTANRVNLFFDATNTLRAFVTGVPSIATSAVITDYNKVALKFKSGDVSVWLNGTEVGTSSNSISLSGLSSLSFNQVSTNSFYGKVKAVVVYKEALTDEQLTCLTTI